MDPWVSIFKAALGDWILRQDASILHSYWWGSRSPLFLEVEEIDEGIDQPSSIHPEDAETCVQES
eukprot:3542841-Amphidinium_carterae.1